MLGYISCFFYIYSEFLGILWAQQSLFVMPYIHQPLRREISRVVLRAVSHFLELTQYSIPKRKNRNKTYEYRYLNIENC